MASIDYTSRDYASLREDLIALVKERIPEWNASDPADVGLAIIEAFAYLGDVTSYYTDRVLNEAYLPTATQRQSILDIARMLGYTPATSMPAVVGAMKVSNASAVPIKIYTGTQFTCNVTDGGQSRRVTFEAQLDSALINWSTTTSLVVPPNGDVTVRATQGQTVYQQVIGVSDGSGDQEFVIPTGSLIEGSLWVASGVIGGYGGVTQTADPLYGYARYGDTIWEAGPINYARSTGIASAGPDDALYTLLLDADQVRVRFGDGLNGRVPPKDHKIYVTYRTGGGKFGNIPAGTRLLGPANISAVALSPAFGGTDYESNASIRKNAPATFRSRNRAVTKRDFRDLALTFPGVAKAQARANNPTQVALYVSPLSTGGYPAPGFYASSIVSRYRTNLSATISGINVSSTPTITVTTSTAHGFSVGQSVTISGNSNANNNGAFAITGVPSATTFTISNASAASVSGGTATVSVATLVLSSIPAGVKTATAASGSSTTTTRTITTTADHGFSSGQVVTVSTGDLNYDGTYVIATVPTTKSFTYTSATSTSSAATLTTKYLTQGTMSAYGIGSLYNKENTGFTLIPADSANPDANSQPRPTVQYSAASGSSEGASGASAVLSAGVVVTGEDTDFTALRANVESFLEERSSAGTNVIVSGPTYSDVVITATIYVEPTVTQSAAIRAAKEALFGFFDYEAIAMGAVIRKTILAVELSKLPEIGYATIDSLALSGQSSAEVISTGVGVIPRLQSGVRSAVSSYSSSLGAGYPKDTYTEGNLVIKIGGSTGIADLGIA